MAWDEMGTSTLASVLVTYHEVAYHVSVSSPLRIVNLKYEAVINCYSNHNGYPQSYQAVRDQMRLNYCKWRLKRCYYNHI